MLGVWLFALVSGWANACLVQQAVPGHGAGPVPGLHGVGVAMPGPIDHDEPAHEDEAAHRLCQSVCDDEQSALPKVGALALPDLGTAPPVPVEAWSFCAAQAQYPSGCPLAAAPPPESAVAIRFLRLTL